MNHFIRRLAFIVLAASLVVASCSDDEPVAPERTWGVGGELAAALAVALGQHRPVRDRCERGAHDVARDASEQRGLQWPAAATADDDEAGAVDNMATAAGYGQGAIEKSLHY